MITFEKEIIVPGDLEEVRERIWRGQSLPGHNDFYINLVERRDETTFLLFINERIHIHELGYHMLSESTSPDQVIWTQSDHKRFIDRQVQWDLVQVDKGVRILCRFEARVVGGEVGEAVTRKVLLDVSRQHFERMLHEFRGQMEWVVKVSDIPPTLIV